MVTATQFKAVELTGSVQSYEWGIKGKDSLVAQMSASNSAIKIEQERPYAELWMGTHVSGPAAVKESGQTLKDFLNGQDLPFLFKILSVRTALSIQAHPDKLLAERLHAQDPKNYRDDNHKPEMAIALGEFEALCGFRSVEQISGFLTEIPALKAVFGCESISNAAELKTSFAHLMNLTADQVSAAIKSMPSSSFSHSELFWRLNTQYPGDVGIFCVFALNYIKLQPGQAVFLAANEPHAYLSGSCVECMATSDNVVRAGLTPKHRDVQTLCEMLTYRTFAGINDLLTVPSEAAPGFSYYASPVPEFSVMGIKINVNDARTFPMKVGHSILLCLEGSAQLSLPNEQTFHAKSGSIIYLPPDCQYTISESSAFIAYQAFEPK